MATHPTQSMQARYEAAQQALAAARAQPPIAARLRQVGLRDAQLEEGEALLAGVRLAMEQVAEARAAQRAATRALRQARTRLHEAIRDASQLALALLEDDPWLAEAGLPHAPDHSLEGLLARSHQFLSAAQLAPPATAQRLATIGLGPDSLALARALLAAVERTHAAQQAQMETAQQAIHIRHNAFETLDDWFRTFATVARVALRDRPDLLAHLGLAPRGRPRATGSGEDER